MPSSQALVPVTNSDLENIQKRIEAFHKLKNECMDDLESCMDEIESQCGEDGEKLVQFPTDFEEMAMEAAEEQRQNAEDEILDEDGNPMWKNFVRTDYLEQEMPENSKLKAIMGKPEEKEKHQKIQKEWAKIKALDRELATTTK